MNFQGFHTGGNSRDLGDESAQERYQAQKELTVFYDNDIVALRYLIDFLTSF